MNIDLADSTVQRLQVWMAHTRAATADDVINKALDCFESKTKPGAVVDRLHVEKTVERFRRYRGLLAGVTVDDIVAWRHKGLP